MLTPGTLLVVFLAIANLFISQPSPVRVVISHAFHAKYLFVYTSSNTYRNYVRKTCYLKCESNLPKKNKLNQMAALHYNPQDIQYLCRNYTLY